MQGYSSVIHALIALGMINATIPVAAAADSGSLRGQVLGDAAPIVQDALVTLSSSSALAPVAFTSAAHLAPPGRVSFTPIAQNRLITLSSSGALASGVGSSISMEPPVPTPVPSSEISQQASDLLPSAVAPDRLTAQATPSPTATATPTATPNAEDQTNTAEDETDKLAKAAQNPIANLISVPFQNNWNFGIGPYDRTQYLLNVQPVIPASLSPDWLLVSRIITPILSQPDVLSPNGSTFGLGDINPSFFFVPKKSANNLTWGVGPVFVFPTATASDLGAGKWSIGPTAVIVWTKDKWVIGALANQVWSFAGDSDRQAVSQFLLQPFINYNLPKGWYLTTSPIITANWIADGGNQWTVPLGGGVGRLFRLGKQPLNASLQAYGYVAKPEGGPDWLLRFQVQLLFPKR
jgi:hypothetical protein